MNSFFEQNLIDSFTVRVVKPDPKKDLTFFPGKERYNPEATQLHLQKPLQYLF